MAVSQPRGDRFLAFETPSKRDTMEAKELQAKYEREVEQFAGQARRLLTSVEDQLDCSDYALAAEEAKELVRRCQAADAAQQEAEAVEEVGF